MAYLSRRPRDNNEMYKVQKTVAFDGAAGNGAVGTVALFTVTGDVMVPQGFGICTESLAGATATLTMGITGNTSSFIGSTTATGITNGTTWQDTSPTTGEGLGTARVVHGNTSIFLTVGTANITDGTITFTLFWRPVSDGASIVAA